jgi:hypothetical protein
VENKNPNEQLGGVVNAWAESQKRMWGDWSGCCRISQAVRKAPSKR